MNLDNFIQDKFDVGTVDSLAEYSFEQIEPIIPELLQWLQAGNWPVSKSMAKFLLTLPPSKLAPYLLGILNSDDQSLKYFMIANLVSGKKTNFDSSFLKEIQRIASNPTEIEIACELNDVAHDALDYLKD